MSNITVEKMLIHNYGLFWDRDKTDWGWPKHTGRLLGVKASAKKTKPVDFWIQQGIYALYDSAFNLVYIGQTGAKKQKLLARLRMHQKNNLSERWKYFSWFGLCAVNKSTNKVKSASDMKSITITLAINHLEAIAISIAEPRLNLQGGKFGKKCQQYLQVPVKREDENTN